MRALTECSLEGDDADKLGAVDGVNTVRPLLVCVICQEWRWCFKIRAMNTTVARTHGCVVA